MFDWLWKANRWYDDLRILKLEKHRFLLFLLSVLAILFLIPLGAVAFFDQPPAIGHLFSLIALIVFAIPRVIWINSKTLGKKFPSKYAKYVAGQNNKTAR